MNDLQPEDNKAGTTSPPEPPPGEPPCDGFSFQENPPASMIQGGEGPEPGPEEPPRQAPPKRIRRPDLRISDAIEELEREAQAARDGQAPAPPAQPPQPWKIGPQPPSLRQIRAHVAESMDLAALIDTLPAPEPARKVTRRPPAPRPPYVPSPVVFVGPERSLVAQPALVRALTGEDPRGEGESEGGECPIIEHKAPQPRQGEGGGPLGAADPEEDYSRQPGESGLEGLEEQDPEVAPPGGPDPHRPNSVFSDCVGQPQGPRTLYGPISDSGKAIGREKLGKGEGEALKLKMKALAKRRDKRKMGIRERIPGEPIPKTKLERIKAIIIDLQHKKIDTRTLPKSIKMRIVQYFLEVQPEVTNPAIGDLLGEERAWVWKAKRELIRDAVFAVTDLDAGDLLSGFRIHKEAMQAKALEKGDYWSAFKMEKEFLEKMADFGLVPRAAKVEERRNLNIDLTKEMDAFVREFGVPTPGELMNAIREGKRMVGEGKKIIEGRALPVGKGDGEEGEDED